MNTKAREIVDALQWLINYYPKWHKEADPCDCMEHAINVIRELSAEVEQRWISVKDATPKEGQDVLVCLDGSTIDTGYCLYDIEGEPYWTAYACMSTNVTHWMHIPELPKEEKTC